MSQEKDIAPPSRLAANRCIFVWELPAGCADGSVGAIGRPRIPKIKRMPTRPRTEDREERRRRERTANGLAP